MGISDLGMALFISSLVLGVAYYAAQQEQANSELRTAIVQVCADRPDPIACAVLVSEALREAK